MFDCCEVAIRSTTVVLHAGPEYEPIDLIRTVPFHRTPLVGELVDVRGHDETFVPVDEVRWDLSGEATITLKLPQDDSNDIEDLLNRGWKRLDATEGE